MEITDKPMQSSTISEHESRDRPSNTEKYTEPDDWEAEEELIRRTEDVDTEQDGSHDSGEEGDTKVPQRKALPDNVKIINIVGFRSPLIDRRTNEKEGYH